MIWGWILKGIANLVFALKATAAGIVGRVLATFGLTMITLNGVLPSLKAFVISKVAGLPSEWLQLLGYLRIGEAMSMILSALAIRMAWKVFIVPTSVADAIQNGTTP